MNHVTHPFGSADICIFSPEIFKFCYITKYRHRLYFGTQLLILLNFFESLRIVLIKIVIILMMLTKLATRGLLKINAFWNKSYKVTVSVHGVTVSNVTVDVVMVTLEFVWEKLPWSEFYKGLTRKTLFWGVVLGQVQ